MPRKPCNDDTYDDFLDADDRIEIAASGEFQSALVLADKRKQMIADQHVFNSRIAQGTFATAQQLEAMAVAMMQERERSRSRSVGNVWPDEPLLSGLRDRFRGVFK